MGALEKPAALVIGGGIAGMQASLDIADAGYQVYLVERELGIGGRMAQLDKTFPTLDCASCTITPRLADVGRNSNIRLITYSEVTGLDGQSGDYQVTVLHKPRYVDLTKCVGCGQCSSACPVSIPDEFNYKLSHRRAAYRLFEQVVPNAFGIDREGRAPCREACPANQRIPGFIALIREGRYEDAYRTLKLDNPFPGICGRICPHVCESACNRAELDQPVNIRALKWFVADQVSPDDLPSPEPLEPIYDDRIAIVGAGPAGLTAAQDLTLAGYRVSVFEALPVAGGMLRVGVPEFRLPEEVIEREVNDILALGIDLHLNTRVENVESLFAEGYSAVLVAVGAHQGIRLPLEGNDLEGVVINTDFLRDVRLRKFEGGDLGRVLVLGGGNVAIDCARTAVRLGAQSVSMACLEDYEHMPAHRWEVEAAEAEDITLYNDRTFRRVLGSGGRVTGVECDSVASFEFDETGRLKVETVPESTHTIEADTVIFAVGQRPELDVCQGVERSPKGTLAVGEGSCRTSQEGVFAAGDAVTGTAFAVDAIAAGHRAAHEVHGFLRSKAGSEEELKRPVDGWRSLTDRPLPVIKMTREDLRHRPTASRQTTTERTYQQLGEPFAEVESPLTEEQALAEAARCLNCGVCAECLQCVAACEAKAIDHNQEPWEEQLDVAAVVVATGFNAFDASRKPNLGFGKYPNVMTGPELERLLSASGPTAGDLVLDDGSVPKDVVFIQCVGSRDIQEGNPYCSRVCCMYTAKQAHLVRERAHDANITVFYIDIRAFGKGFEEFHERVRLERVVYRRGNVSEVIRGSDGRLIVKAEDTLLGKPVEVPADLVILATGLVAREDTCELADILGLEIGTDGFFQEGHPKLNPSGTGVPGIFLAGAAQGPKDILDSVAHAKAAAASAMVVLSQLEARGRELRAAAD